MQGNLTLNLGPTFRVLSDDQCRQIHFASLEILETTGVALGETRALELLHSAGARIDAGRVKIPSHLVEQAIQSAPSRVMIYDREGRKAMSLGGRNFYFGGQSDLVNYLDPTRGERRRLVSDDIAVLTALVDALPNLDFTICGSEASDYPPALVARVAFIRTIQNTTKPIGFVSEDAKDLSEILEVASRIVGGHEQLSARPFIIHYAEPVSPLQNYDPAVRKLLLCAERNIPVIYAPMPQGGATAPATFAGILAQAGAESLGGLVAHQLKRHGAPFIFGAIPTHFDMRSMILPYGAPEMHLLSAAMADMAHYYQLPVFGTAGCTDAKAIDGQAGVEVALSIFMAAASGAHLIHDVGLMDHATILYPDFLVFNDEVISMVKNYFRPVAIDPEALALEVIDGVGPGGHFLEEPHTLAHFKEDWYPLLFDRSTVEMWLAEGGKSLAQRLRQRTEEILQSHRPKPLPEDIARELEAMQAQWLVGQTS